MPKKLLTINDLIQFCKVNNFQAFSSKDAGYKIAVQIPATFELEDTDDNKNGFLLLKIKVAHIGLNRNRSFISEDTMKKALPSLKDRPVLGYIHELDDGTYDFGGHEIELVQNENGDEEVKYVESPIGHFLNEDPVLEYDKENDKTYVVAYAKIYEEYTKAADILRRKNGTKNSCEIDINSFSFNTKENYFEITDFTFSGSTMLGSCDDGTPIEEGMEGSRADIVDFSEQNNSMFVHTELTNNSKEDDNGKEESNLSLLEKFLKKYNKTKEDITFDYENLSDEELLNKLKETFTDIEIDLSDFLDEDENDEDLDNGDEVEETEEVEEEDEDENDEDEDDEDEEDDYDDDTFSLNAKPSKKITFEISVNKLWDALNKLLDNHKNENEWWSVVEVYQTYFIVKDYYSYKFFKQSYSINGNNVGLDGDAVEVFPTWSTQEQLDALKNVQKELDTTREVYEQTKAELEEYKSAEIKAEKENILADELYSAFVDEDEFKNLKEEMDKFSVDEFKEKADIAFAKCIKRMGGFSALNTTKHSLGNPSNDTTKNPYGNLFD